MNSEGPIVTDIVERLRELDLPICDEAAITIGRLRAALVAARNELEGSWDGDIHGTRFDDLATVKQIDAALTQ
jgi:hypothetical protein